MKSLLPTSSWFLLIWTKVLSRDSQANNGQRIVGNLLQQHRFLNERIFTFVSKFAAFSAANIELWLHKPPTAHKKVDAKLFLLSCFIYFHINWIFPSEKHETSLGILRVKPEVSSISSAGFPFFLSFSPFIYIKSTSVLFPFISVMVKSIHELRMIKNEKIFEKNSANRIFIDDNFSDKKSVWIENFFVYCFVSFCFSFFFTSSSTNFCRVSRSWPFHSIQMCRVVE